MWDNCFCMIRDRNLKKGFNFYFPLNVSCYEFLGSSNLQSWRAIFMCKLRRQCFTRHIHALLRYYRERLCGTSPGARHTNHSAKLVLNGRRCSLTLNNFSTRTRPVSKSLLANDNLSLKGHKLNRAALISTRNSPDCNSRNIRMRARVHENVPRNLTILRTHFRSPATLPSFLDVLPA